MIFGRQKYQKKTLFYSARKSRNIFESNRNLLAVCNDCPVHRKKLVLNQD